MHISSNLIGRCHYSSIIQQGPQRPATCYLGLKTPRPQQPTFGKAGKKLNKVKERPEYTELAERKTHTRPRQMADTKKKPWTRKRRQNSSWDGMNRSKMAQNNPKEVQRDVGGAAAHQYEADTSPCPQD
jgi:hypothetical protein